MKDKYFVVAFIGTMERETGDLPQIPLYARAGDLSGLPSFADKDITAMPETDIAGYLPAGIIGVLDERAEGIKPIQLFASVEEWFELSKTISGHITGKDDE